MKYIILLIPFLISFTCRSTPVLGKTLDWTQWAVPQVPVSQTVGDIAPTTPLPVVAEAPWLKWAKLKGPVTTPSDVSSSSNGGLPGSAPAAPPWSIWMKAKPIPAFIKPKLFTVAPSSAPVQSVIGQSSSVPGLQSKDLIITQDSSSLANRIPPAFFNDPNFKLILESLGISQQTPQVPTSPILPWSKPPTFPSTPGNLETVTSSKGPAIPETFWTQLLKLTSPKVSKTPIPEAKDIPLSKIELTTPPETPAPAAAALPLSGSLVQPVTEAYFSPAVLDKFLKSFPELSEALLKSENAPPLAPVENSKVNLSADSPTINIPETGKTPAVAEIPTNLTKEASVESPSTPQELFLQLLKLKGIPVSSVLDSEDNSSVVADTTSPSSTLALPKDSTLSKASLEKLGLSEPVLSRLIQLLAAPSSTNKNITTEIAGSMMPKNITTVIESPVPIISTAENTPAPEPLTTPEPIHSAPPSNPETFWTEWLKLKTPKISGPVPPKIPTTPMVPPPSSAETPEAPWMTLIKSQTPLPLNIIPPKNIEVSPLPVKVAKLNTPDLPEGTESLPTAPEAILTERLKSNTSQTPVALPTTSIPSQVLPTLSSVKNVLPSAAVTPPFPQPSAAVPVTLEEILTEWLKQKTPKIPVPIPPPTPIVSQQSPVVPWAPNPIVPLPPAVVTPPIPQPAPSVPGTPEEILTEWLKLKTPKIPVPISPTKTPTTLMVPQPSPVVPNLIVPTLTTVNSIHPPAAVVSPHPAVAVPVNLEAILTEWLKQKTPKIPAPIPLTETPTAPMIPPPSPVVPGVPNLIVPGLATVDSVILPPAALIPPNPDVPAAIPATQQAILNEWLKLKAPKISYDNAKTSLVPPLSAAETPEAPWISWIKSQTPLPTISNTPSSAALVPPIIISDSVPAKVATLPEFQELPLGVEEGLPITPEEIWAQWLNTLTTTEVPVKTIPDEAITKTKPKPDIKLDLPLPPPGVQLPNAQVAKLNTTIPDVNGNVISSKVFADAPPLPITVDGITIPADVWTKLLKMDTQIFPSESSPTPPKPESTVTPLPLQLGQKILTPISSELPVTLDGIPIPQQLLAELLKLKTLPPSMEKPINSSKQPPVISSLIAENTNIPLEITPGNPLPIIPASTTISSLAPTVEWTPLAPVILNTPESLQTVSIPAPAPLTPEAIWAQLLKLNSTEIRPPTPNPVVEPPWIKWIKMKSPLPVLPEKAEVSPADNLIQPESETLFASWLKPLATSETPALIEGDALLVPTLKPKVSPNETEEVLAKKPEELVPVVVPTAPTSHDVSKVPIPVGLPETFWTELIKSYTLSENKTEKPVNITVTEKPVPVDPWTEWLQKLDTLVSTPIPETVSESVEVTSTPSTHPISEAVVFKGPLHNLTCCEWLAKLLPQNVLDETLKKLQQTRSLKSPNARHHHSPEETSSSEEMKRAVEMPEVGLANSSPATQPKLDIVPPGFWDAPTTTEASTLSAFVDPAFWAAKKAMFISNLFSALAKVAMNATAEPPAVRAVATQFTAPIDKSSGSVPILTNNKARSASSDSEEESSESRLKRKSKKKASTDKKRPFIAKKQKGKSVPKTPAKPTKKTSKPKKENKNKTHHSNHHHNHHRHHSVKKSSETTTTTPSTTIDNSQPKSSTTTTTENPVDFASLAKALLV